MIRLRCPNSFSHLYVRGRANVPIGVAGLDDRGKGETLSGLHDLSATSSSLAYANQF